MSRTLNHRSILIVVLTMALPSMAIACLWDHDTIKMERSRFPTTLELITGKFLRHSPEFYEWRIKNRLARLEKDPNNVLLLDDLAVAYDKTGKHDKAIETAERIEKIQPGRYETAANLGTFYFHSGQLKEGLPFIDKALKINPDAHFGREKYQKLLVEYVLKSNKKIPQGLPLLDFVLPEGEPETNGGWPLVGFNEPMLMHFHIETMAKPESSWNNRRDALKGILGMMKFGNFESPVLLEAVGAILSTFNEREKDAKQLACRAFLKASYLMQDKVTQSKYRWMARSAINLQVRPGTDHDNLSLKEVEADFKKELAEADAWYAELREREIGWIRDGIDPEIEFDKLYTTEPEVSGMNVLDPHEIRERRVRLVLWSLGSISIITVIYFLWRRLKRRVGTT